METAVDEDYRTFTNISLADDTGKSLTGFFSSCFLQLTHVSFLLLSCGHNKSSSFLLLGSRLILPAA